MSAKLLGRMGHPIRDLPVSHERAVEQAIAVEHRVVAHLLRDHVGGELGIVGGCPVVVEPARYSQPLVERRLRDRHEQSDHRRLDARLHDEAVLLAERLHRVVIEADDESREHVDSIGVDLLDRRKHVAADVLKLEGLLQALLVGRFDADEHPLEVRLAEKPKQLVVLRDVQRHLGSEVEPVFVFRLVLVQKLEEPFCQRLVADQVVVDEEGGVDVHRAQ